MSKRTEYILLEDILQSCQLIIQYTEGIDYDIFESNTMLRQAVERNIEIIGEACNKLPDGFLAKHNSVEWHKAIGMRNRLIHGYFEIDILMLWNTATIVIPDFKKQIEYIFQNEV